MARFEGQVAIVTGAGTGIGRGIASKLGGEGARILIVDRDAALGEKAAGELAAEGISVELIDPRTVLPLDTDTIIASVAKTGRLLVVDEAFAPASIGAQIAAIQADRGFDDLDAPIKRIHGAFTPIPYSPSLEAAVVPHPETVAAAVRDLVAE